mgnify:CR=1 FL=1
MKVLKNDKDYLEKIRYLYKIRLLALGLNEVNTDIHFKNNYYL